ncbi:MAG: hypothetical protein AABW59_01175 [archaeon]
MKMHALLIIAIFLAVLLIIPTAMAECEIAHCWYISGEISITPTNTWNGCYASMPSNVKINNIYYPLLVLPGSYLSSSGFGNINFRCDNGASASSMNFVLMYINGVRYTTNVSGGGAAVGSGYEYCGSSGGCYTQSGVESGSGNLDQMVSQTFSTADIGKVFDYAIKYMKYPIANSYGTEEASDGFGTAYISPPPSLLVFAQGDENFGFYEKNGYYEREVFFTLANKFPLDVNLDGYSIKCSPGAECTIDTSNIGYTISGQSGLMIIPGNIRVNKGNLPESVTMSLDVNYSIPLFKNKAACAPYVKNSTSSKPMVYEIGLLDQQDFQVGLIAAKDQNFCIGEDGMIGQTGPSYAPKVNIGFGGPTSNVDQELISVDECDLYTPSSTGTRTDNNDAVYCSQREFLLELTRKIAEIARIRELKAADKNSTAQEAVYANFEAYLRKQDFSTTSVTSSSSTLGTYIGEFQKIGLESYFGQTKTEQLEKAKKVMDSIIFENTGTFPAGLYTVSIEITELSPQTTSTYLFNGNALNTFYQIKIKLNTKSTPQFNWMFYEMGTTELDESSIARVQIGSGDYYTSNNSKRGIVLEMVYDKKLTHADSNALYNTFAVPMIIRSADKNEIVDKNFGVEVRAGVNPTSPPLFTYWTAFASTLGSGCETIENTALTSLPYRTPDTALGTYGTGLSFNIDFLNSTKKDQNMYSSTVLFLPKGVDNINEGVKVYAPFRVITKDKTCDGNSTNFCQTEINSASSTYNLSTSTPLASVFSKVSDGSLCVYQGINDSGKNQWTVFWNQAQVLSDLDAKKNAITDANICTTRAILGS